MGGKEEKNLKSGGNLGNPEMLYEKPNLPHAGSSLGKEKREGGVKTWKKGGFAAIKIKAGLFFSLPSLSTLSGSVICSAAPARRPLAEGSSIPPCRGGLCKSSPSSRESGLIQYYRVEKGRRNPVEMAAPAEGTPCKNPPPKKKRGRPSQL